MFEIAGKPASLFNIVPFRGKGKNGKGAYAVNYSDVRDQSCPC